MKKAIFLFSLLILFCLTSCSLKSTKHDDFSLWINSTNLTLIDIRETEELENDGKIAEALHIPKNDIPNHIEEIKKMPKPIVIFCRSGNRAEDVVKLLKENHIEKVYNGGGLVDVQEALKTQNK